MLVIKVSNDSIFFTAYNCVKTKCLWRLLRVLRLCKQGEVKFNRHKALRQKKCRDQAQRLYRWLFFLPVQWMVFKQSNRKEWGLLFSQILAKNNNDLYCYAVSSKFFHLCSTCKRASYPIDDYLLHNFKIMKPPRTHMQNPDGFWEAWGTQSHVTRVTYRPGGRSYLMFKFLGKNGWR